VLNVTAIAEELKIDRRRVRAGLAHWWGKGRIHPVELPRPANLRAASLIGYVNRPASKRERARIAETRVGRQVDRAADWLGKSHFQLAEPITVRQTMEALESSSRTACHETLETLAARGQLSRIGAVYAFQGASREPVSEAIPRELRAGAAYIASLPLGTTIIRGGYKEPPA
jgi:hypothetical protein